MSAIKNVDADSSPHCNPENAPNAPENHSQVNNASETLFSHLLKKTIQVLQMPREKLACYSFLSGLTVGKLAAFVRARL